MNQLIAALVLSLAAPALAREGGPGAQAQLDPAAQAEKETAHLKERLKLTDDQAKKVGAVISKNIDERVSLEKKLREHERKTHEAVRAVLNDEQKETLDMMRAHRMMMRQGGRPGGGGGPGRGRMRRPGGDKDQAGEPSEHADHGGPEDGPKGPPPPDEKD